MAYILDSDWALSALKGRPAAVDPLDRLLAQRVFVSRITVAELYEGAFHTVHPEALIVSVRHFLSAFTVLEITDPVTVVFSELRAMLRRRGDRIPDFDLLIAATALHHNLTLLTFNRRHFDRVPELKIYHVA